MSTPKRILLAVVVLVIAFLFAGCAAIVGIGLLLGDSFGETYEEASFATIDEWPAAETFEENFELDFPPSARDIHAASDGFQDPIYQFRFTIDAEELPILASSVGCNGLLSQQASEPPMSAVNEEAEWWDPGTATVFQECVGIDTPFREQQVFVDLSDPDEVKVYIVAFYF